MFILFLCLVCLNLVVTLLRSFAELMGMVTRDWVHHLYAKVQTGVQFQFGFWNGNNLFTNLQL